MTYLSFQELGSRYEHQRQTQVSYRLVPSYISEEVSWRGIPFFVTEWVEANGYGSCPVHCLIHEPFIDKTQKVRVWKCPSFHFWVSPFYLNDSMCPTKTIRPKVGPKGLKVLGSWITWQRFRNKELCLDSNVLHPGMIEEGLGRILFNYPVTTQICTYSSTTKFRYFSFSSHDTIVFSSETSSGCLDPNA